MKKFSSLKCPKCGKKPCVCKSCSECGKDPCHCMQEGYVTEAEDAYHMARNQLTTAMRGIERLMDMCKGKGDLEPWVQAKLARATEMLDGVADYLESGGEDA
jgi:hypothetical protein